MKILMSLLLFTLSLLSTSNTYSDETPENYFVHLKAATRQDRNEIANLIHMDQIVEDSVYAVVNKHDFQQLKKKLPHLIRESHALTPAIINKGSTKKLNTLEDVHEFPTQDEKYHTYQEVVTELRDLNQKYPEITSLFSIGKSVNGMEIVGIRITTEENKDSPNFIPGILFVGAHHAREHLSTEVPMGLINHLLKSSSKDQEVRKLINNRDIYFIPMLNPDGAMYDIAGKRYKMWRKNRKVNKDGSFGVDLNRNYSYGWGTGGSSNSPQSDVYMGKEPFSEPETLNLKTFIESKANIRVVLSFHTFSELILYPWGGKYDGVGGNDELAFKKLAETMAKWNNYTPEQASDLYIASGDTCDWAYGEHGIFCFTFELSPKSSWFGGGFYPGASAIDKTFQSNLKPSLYLIDMADNPLRVLE